MTGCFQFMYTWTSIFTLYLSIFEVFQRSYIYFIGSIIVIWMFYNFKSQKIINELELNKKKQEKFYNCRFLIIL